MQNSNVQYNLIFDVSNIFYRSHSVYKNVISNYDLANQEHKNMLVRKFVIDICSFGNKFNVLNLFFCFDSHSFRKLIDSDYKSKRLPSEEKNEFYKTLQLVYDLLVFKNLNAIKINCLEADDICALTASKFKHLLNIIISADNDVKQLVNNTVLVFNPIKNQEKIYHCLNLDQDKMMLSQQNFKTEQILAHYKLAEKLLKGCISDNVPSLVQKGFRTKKIIEIADRFLKYQADENKVNQDFECWLYAINHNTDLNISSERLYKQMQLVCLKHEYMPKESVSKFNKYVFKDNRNIDLTANAILSNTVYFD